MHLARSAAILHPDFCLCSAEQGGGGDAGTRVPVREGQVRPLSPGPGVALLCCPGLPNLAARAWGGRAQRTLGTPASCPCHSAQAFHIQRARPASRCRLHTGPPWAAWEPQDHGLRLESIGRWSVPMWATGEQAAGPSSAPEHHMPQGSPNLSAPAKPGPSGPAVQPLLCV